MSDHLDHKNFKGRQLPFLIVGTYKEWRADEPFRLIAIAAYYAVLSHPALFVIILNTLGDLWRTKMVKGEEEIALVWSEYRQSYRKLDCGNRQ